MRSRRRPTTPLLRVECLEDRCTPSTAYLATDLVSDQQRFEQESHATIGDTERLILTLAVGGISFLPQLTVLNPNRDGGIYAWSSGKRKPANRARGWPRRPIGAKCTAVNSYPMRGRP